MVSIVEQGGFQYKVSEGDTIQVPTIGAEEGAEVVLEKVLLVGEGDELKVGEPVVEGAEVKAKVLNHGKADKVLVVKKKRRKDYKRVNGHRQGFSLLQITSISAK